MAKKFLPFAKDNTSALDIYTSLISYAGRSLSPKKLASLFYIVAPNVEKIKKYTVDTKNRSDTEHDVVEKILENYSHSPITSKDISKFIYLSFYIKMYNCEDLKVDLDNLNVTEIAIFLYVLTVQKQIDSFTHLDFSSIVGEDTISYYNGSISELMGFNENGRTIYFDDNLDLEAYILYALHLKGSHTYTGINPVFLPTGQYAINAGVILDNPPTVPDPFPGGF